MATQNDYAKQASKSVVWRRDKQGFSMPQDSWISGSLNKRIRYDYLDDNSLIFKNGILDKKKVIKNLIISPIIHPNLMLGIEKYFVQLLLNHGYASIKVLLSFKNENSSH